jgi:ribosomal protein S17E
VGPRAGLDYVEKRKFLTLPGLEPRLLGRLARSQSADWRAHVNLKGHLNYRAESLTSSRVKSVSWRVISFYTGVLLHRFDTPKEDVYHVLPLGETDATTINRIAVYLPSAMKRRPFVDRQLAPLLTRQSI